jgi:hypothetical protein
VLETVTMLRMKAMKSFFGDEGKIKAGREFDVRSKQRADDLEVRGLAVLVGSGRENTEPAIRNKAADAGPLADSAGGETGAASAPSSSRPAPALRSRDSKR